MKVIGARVLCGRLAKTASLAALSCAELDREDSATDGSHSIYLPSDSEAPPAPRRGTNGPR